MSVEYQAIKMYEEAITFINIININNTKNKNFHKVCVQNKII